MEVGVRIDSKMYFKFIIDTENRNIDVVGEVIENGEKVEPTGSVVWEGGE